MFLPASLTPRARAWKHKLTHSVPAEPSQGRREGGLRDTAPPVPQQEKRAQHSPAQPAQGHGSSSCELHMHVASGGYPPKSSARESIPDSSAQQIPPRLARRESGVKRSAFGLSKGIFEGAPGRVWASQASQARGHVADLHINCASQLPSETFPAATLPTTHSR